MFDSGVGGLTVLKAFRNAFPQADIQYVGDTLHMPYGDKSPDNIRDFSRHIARYLRSSGAELIVIACNSASSWAYEAVCEEAGNIPVLDVVRPVVHHLAKQPNLSQVGLVGTRATVQSGIYPRLLKALAPNIHIDALATPLLAPLVEEGIQLHELNRLLVSHYLQQLPLDSMQALVLACTHYPLMEKKIQSFLPENVKLVTQGDIVAKSLATYLQNHPEMDQKCSKNGQLLFFTTDNPTRFEEQVSLFFGQKIAANHTDLA
jgi:glutamate racemase